MIKPQASELIRKILEKSPEKRLSIDEIRKHIWFTTKSTPVREQTGIFVGYSSIDYDTDVL